MKVKNDSFCIIKGVLKIKRRETDKNVRTDSNYKWQIINIKLI